MSESKWNGEGLPPVGWHGECIWGDRARWFECIVLPLRQIAKDKYGDWEITDIDRLPGLEFRPMPTHRDRVIEKARAKTRSNADALEVIDDLYDAGMLVDSQPKRMSREEANAAMSEALRDVPFTVKHRTALLDALGYTEDGE